MINPRTTRSNWSGARIVFLLTLSWNGRTYYLSTEPITLDTDYSTIQFAGGLAEIPSINDSMSSQGFEVGSYSTSIAGYINVDIAKQAEQGNTMESAIAELAYIAVRSTNKPTYQQRHVIVKGKLKEPIYGYRDRGNGYFEASIESDVLQGSFHELSMGSMARIGAEELSDLVNPTLSPLSAIQNVNYILDLLETHKGKVMPIVFGQGGIVYDIDMNSIRFPTSPAYVLYAESGSTNKIWLAIAPHAVEADRVYIYDDLGNFRLEDVEQWIRNDGRIFSFVHFTHSSGGFQNPVDETNARYFVNWYDGGGLVSINDNSAITGAGDVCMFILSQGAQDIDFLAWESLLPYLNSYKLSGYINNIDMSPLELLENEIIPLLPISVVNGRYGLKPVLDILSSGITPKSITTITCGADFASTSGIALTGDTSSLINDFTLKYAYDLSKDEYKASMRITGESTITSQNIFTNQYAQNSLNKYGSRTSTMESSFVADSATASLICFDKIRIAAAPVLIVEYTASPRYGYLDVGDIIKITDESYSFNEKMVQITQKQWRDNYWIFQLKIPEEV